tara:strand:+ start:351 stop:611 length:261 start_codon:yes stop_codon:yes gene_type:complete
MFIKRKHPKIIASEIKYMLKFENIAKIKAIMSEYNVHWPFRPSNIFNALIKIKKHKILNSFEKLYKKILLSKKEKERELIIKLLSI